MNILLTITYDGTNYAGWQRQDNAIAVQQRLEEALQALLGREIKLQSASRTDAGVHALGQRAAFKVSEMPIPLDKLPQVLTNYLPKDIAIQAAYIVPDDFNPRFMARAKTYCYQIYSAPTPNPLVCRYSAFVPVPLDSYKIKKMAQAASFFKGTHDFAAFCATGSSAKTTVRTIFDCKAEMEGNMARIIVTGDGFLYNMVRIMAGTILYAGTGKILPSDIPKIIASKDRTKAGKTMPPEGLTLVEVMYEEEL